MGNSLNCVKKNQEIEHQLDELMKFTKYPKLIPDLRRHLLTYCFGSTLINFSQCSKFCNSEVQMLNTVPPRSITIREEGDGFVVEICYVKSLERQEGAYLVLAEDIKEISIEKKFMISENMTEEIGKYLMKFYQYTGQKSTKCLKVDVQQWPNDLLKINHMINIEEWDVTMNQSMFDDFMENFTNSDHGITQLTLRENSESSHLGIICSDFFKSEAFRNLQKFVCFFRCEIDTEDFINMEKETVYLISSMDFDAIRAKVTKWNNAIHMESRQITISFPENDRRRLDVSVIFPADQFDVVPIDMQFDEKVRVGKVVVELGQNMFSRSLSLTVEKDEE